MKIRRSILSAIFFYIEIPRSFPGYFDDGGNRGLQRFFPAAPVENLLITYVKE